MSATPYRPDIDGLRAVAVLAVVVYHAWPHALPGGFVGVDVFFVISGYLITRILLVPGVSFADFYRRRIRRIFPALLIVLASTLALGATFLPPDNFRNLLGHTIGGGLFVANFVAYHDVGYFSGAADLKPLVHLWSLGVEEQFYLLWPVVVWIAVRKGVLTRACVIGALLSFAAFAWLSEANPRAAFYLSPSRFWELLAGALLVGVAVPARWRTVASTAGLGLIAASAVLIASETEFPGVLLLVPTLGAALVIAAPGAHPVGRLLSSRGAVAIGLISYPLYLWHWPLLSLLRNFQRSPSTEAIATVIVVSTLLAMVTYRIVERPLVRFSPHRVATALSVALLGFLAFAANTHARLPSDTREMTNAACTRRFSYQPPGLWACLLSKESPPTVLLLGDSHAHHLYQGLAGALPQDAVLSIGSCLPTIGLVFTERAGATGICANENFKVQSDYLHTHVLLSPSLKWIVISAMWRPFDETGQEIDYWTGRRVASTFAPIEGTPLQSYVGALERQIERLGDIPITIVLDTPRRGVSVGEQRQRQAAFRNAVDQLARRHANVSVFDPMPVLCTELWCRWDQLRDFNHLTSAGSVAVATALAASPLSARRR